jgi:tetratricopeptide (TPR) repeat protein
MIKINVDENPAISAQLRIQSIPTVYAFFQGKPVDGFQGAIPGSQIAQFIDKLVAMSPEPDGGLADAIIAAEAMLEEGAVLDAIETFAAILGEEPENPQAYAGLIRAHIAAGELPRAQDLLAAVPAAEPAPESWATSDASGLLQESFADAHPKVRALLGAAASPFVTGIFDRPVLDTFHKGRVVLLGDAAHPFVPYLSNGAAQAIEDAHVMATVLARAGAGAMSIDEAIPEYEQRRRARVDTVQRMSRESLRTHHLADPASIAERNERYRRAQQSDPQGATLRMWLWGYDVIADADRPLQAAALGKTALERLPVP